MLITVGRFLIVLLQKTKDKVTTRCDKVQENSMGGQVLYLVRRHSDMCSQGCICWSRGGWALGAS